MANRKDKKQNPLTVQISRNGVKRDISTAQWEAMKKSNSTYGWKLASDLSDEIISKEKDIEASKIAELEAINKSLEEQNNSLKELGIEQVEKIKELESEKEGLNNELNSKNELIEGLEAQLKKLTQEPKNKDNGKAN